MRWLLPIIYLRLRSHIESTHFQVTQPLVRRRFFSTRRCRDEARSLSYGFYSGCLIVFCSIYLFPMTHLRIAAQQVDSNGYKLPYNNIVRFVRRPTELLPFWISLRLATETVLLFGGSSPPIFFSGATRGRCHDLSELSPRVQVRMNGPSGSL